VDPKTEVDPNSA